MNRVDLSNIEIFKETVSDNYKDKIKQTNTLAAETYNLLSEVSTSVTNVTNKITVLGDMFTDLRVLNGSAKTVQYLSSLDVVENSGLKIDNNEITLDILSKQIKEISVKKSSISSLDNYSLKTLTNKTTYLDNFLKSGIETVVSFPTKRYTFTLNLQYNTPEQINSIDLQLGLTTESYPIINSIKYLDRENILRDVIILNNNSTNYNLDENRVRDNLYTIDTNTVTTTQLFIEFTSKESSSIVLKDIKTSFKTEVESGYVVLGPIYSEHPILKLAIDSSEISTGVSFEISTDLEYWLSLENSSSIVSTGSKKILAFNTVNNNSIKTEEDIYSFYVKLSVESSELSNENLPIDVYNTHREDNSVSTDIISLVEANLFSAYKVKNSDYIYGKYNFMNSLNTKDFDFGKVEYVENNGVLKVLGLIDTPFSITETNSNGSNIGSMGAELKLQRLTSNGIIEASSFDIANSVIYDIYPRQIKETINIKQKDNLCFLLKGRYKDVVNKPTTVPPVIPVDPPLATIMCEGAISQVVLKSDPTNYESPATFNVYVNDSKIGSNINMFILNQGWSYDPILKENSQRLNYSVWGDSSGFDYFYNSSGKHIKISIVPSNEAAKNIISISSLNENTTATLLENGGVSFCLAPQPSEDYLTYGGWFGEGWLSMYKYKIEVNGVQYEDDRTYYETGDTNYIGSLENVISRNAPNLDFLSAWVSSGGGGTLSLNTPGTYDIKLIPQASTNQPYWDQYMSDNALDQDWGKPYQESGTPITIDPITGVWSFTLYKA